MLRKGAKEGDYVAVTGFIGDAFIGLKLLQKKLNTSNNSTRLKMINSFLYPPQLHKLANQLSHHVNSCIGISDGLIEDIGKLGALSNCKVSLSAKEIPLSNYAKSLIKKKNLCL